MKAIFTCLLFSIVLAGFGQNTFKVRAFSPNYSYLSQVIQLNDGSFVGAGSMATSVNGYEEAIYVLKVDGNGISIASKTLNLTNIYGFVNSIVKTADGGFAIFGQTDSQPVLIKFTADLSIQWQKSYSIKNIQGWSAKVLQTADGGYMLAGNIYDNNKTQGFVLKTDGLGEILSSQEYFLESNIKLNDLTALSDGNYALLGITNYDEPNDTIRVVKIKPDGTIMWSKYFINNNNNDIELSYFTASSDGGVVITGNAYISDADVEDYQLMMIKFDGSGNLLWSQSTVTAGNSEFFATSVMEDKDGGYIFCGEFDTRDEQYNYDTTYGYILKTNVLGQLQWTKTYEPSYKGFTHFNKIIRTSDGGYAACGEGYFLKNDDYYDESFLYKFNSSFQACNETTGSNGTVRSFGTSGSETISTAAITSTVSNITTTLSDAGTIDNVCSSNVLPLQILSFNAALQNKNVAVQWTTANEVNTSYFVVEKSKDAIVFTALQQVIAKGNSAGVQTYSATDLEPLAGINYYRLKEVDKDGKITYSSVVPVTILSNGAIVISPNPVQNAVKIFVQSRSNSGILLQITDMAGRILAAKTTYVTTGANTISLPAASLSKGVYILKVRQNNQVKSVQFLKK